MNVCTDGIGPIWPDEDFTFEGWQDTRYCALTLTTDEGRTILGRGVARRDPHDKHNPTIGQQLALGRALEDAARRILKRANGEVKHAEDVAADRQKRREEQVQQDDEAFETPRGNEDTGWTPQSWIDEIHQFTDWRPRPAPWTELSTDLNDSGSFVPREP